MVMTCPKNPRNLIYVSKRRSLTDARPVVRVLTRVRGPIITGRRVRQPACSDYVTHTQALNIAAKNKKLVDTNALLLSEMREISAELNQLRTEHFVYKATVKKDFAARLLQMPFQDIFQYLQMVVQSPNHYHINNNIDSFLEFGSPGRTSSSSTSARIDHPSASQPQLHRSQSSSGILSNIPSTSALRSSSRCSGAGSKRMTEEAKEQHRLQALDKMEEQRYANGTIPLTPVHEVSSTLTTADAGSLTESLSINSTVAPASTSRISAAERKEDPTMSIDMNLVNMNESHFGPTNCSTERKKSEVSAPASGPMKGTSNKSKRKPSAERLSIFDFEPVFISPQSGGAGREEEDSYEDYAGDTAEDDDGRTRFSSSLSSLEDNTYRPSFVNASLLRDKSFQRQCGIRADDSDHTPTNVSMIPDNESFGSSARLRSHEFGLLTDSPGKTSTETIVASTLPDPDPITVVPAEPSIYDFEDDAVENEIPKKGRKKPSKKPGSVLKPEDEQSQAVTGKRKKGKEPKNSRAGKKTTGKNNKKEQDMDEVSTSSPFVTTVDLKKKSCPRKSSGIHAPNIENRTRPPSSSLIDPAEGGDSFLADSTLNVSTRPSRKAKENVKYIESPIVPTKERTTRKKK